MIATALILTGCGSSASPSAHLAGSSATPGATGTTTNTGAGTGSGSGTGTGTGTGGTTGTGTGTGSGSGGGTTTPTGNTTSTGCGSTIDPTLFASTAMLKSDNDTIAGFGLRAPGSDAHNKNIQWIENRMKALPGFTVTSSSYEIDRWQPTPVAADGSRDLVGAGQLSVTPVGGKAMPIAVSGAVPQALPSAGVTAPLVYIPTGTAITAANAKGKIVIRDWSTAPIPYAELAAVSWFLTPDLAGNLGGNYDRPYIAVQAVTDDLIAAGQAGAAGMVSAFFVPRKYVTGYWDPHQGTRFAIPAVFVGVDEGMQLKTLAATGASATLGVLATEDKAMTRTLTATLPGQSPERMIVVTHTDGVGYVEENGAAAMMALADYFSRRPLSCRPRTLQFVFTSSHLSYRYDSTFTLAKQLDADYDGGTVAFDFPIEHLGTREILPVARTDGGPGQDLAFSGKGEALGWFAGTESPVMAQAVIQAVQSRGLDGIGVLKGQDVPNPQRVPTQCSQGGLGTYPHSFLVPTISIITGPWSLWAPSYGASAIDFERMHSEVLAAGDVILALSTLPKESIAGAYLAERQMRANGYATCDHTLPPEQAPGPSS